MTATLNDTLSARATTEESAWREAAVPVWASASELFAAAGYLLRAADGALIYPHDVADPAWRDTVATRLPGLGGQPDVLFEDDAQTVVGARIATMVGDLVLAVVVDKPGSVAPESLPIWTPDAALRALSLLQRQIEDARHAHFRLRELESISEECSRTYEEISLLHHLASNLRVTEHPEHLAERAADWLADCLPTDAVVLVLYDHTSDERLAGRVVKVQYVAGDNPLTDAQTRELFQILPEQAQDRPLVINGNNEFGKSELPFGLTQLVAVPVVESHTVFGFLALLNHSAGGEFGTTEASLSTTIASILGVHAGNSRLYAKQAKLLENVVRAMVSAIDAKDPYTCGHSNRVARIAVAIARQLGLGEHDCDTIYLSGLLHDIGKIGVDDAVLQKDGRLTDEEFEHIKRHPTLGAKILADIEQFSEIIPGVLYHHEQWNGTGYPEGLAGERIPQIARIIAVADAFDAMTSDRPYRRGMPVERVEEIFRGGRDVQWDARVIDAYFGSREQILGIIRQEREELPQSVAAWSAIRTKARQSSADMGADGEPQLRDLG